MPHLTQVKSQHISLSFRTCNVVKTGFPRCSINCSHVKASGADVQSQNRVGRDRTMSQLFSGQVGVFVFVA